MDPQNLINLAFAAIGTLAGWVLKNIWDAVTNLRNDLRDIEQNLHGNYVRRDDFKDSIDRIEALCHRIFDKLDGKVDKS